MITPLAWSSSSRWPGVSSCAGLHSYPCPSLAARSGGPFQLCVSAWALWPVYLLSLNSRPFALNSQTFLVWFSHVSRASLHPWGSQSDDSARALDHRFRLWPHMVQKQLQIFKMSTAEKKSQNTSACTFRNVLHLGIWKDLKKRHDIDKRLDPSGLKLLPCELHFSVLQVALYPGKNAFTHLFSTLHLFAFVSSLLLAGPYAITALFRRCLEANDEWRPTHEGAAQSRFDWHIL